MIEKPASVRIATEQDEQHIFDLLIIMHRENPLARMFPYDATKVFSAIEVGTRRRGGIIGVIDDPERPRLLATTGILFDSWWWSQAMFASPKWFLVRPDARHGRRLTRELADFVLWVRESVARDMVAAGDKTPFLLETGFTSLSQIDAKERLWRRLFQGRKTGSVFLSGL